MMDEEAGLLLVIGWWDGRGGLQVILREMVDGLRTRRPVTVITWHERLHRPTRETDGGLTVIRLPLVASWDVKQPLLGFANTAVCVVSALAAGVATRRRWKTALAADLSPMGVIAVLLGRLLRRRAVATSWIPGPAGQAARLRRSPIAPALRRLLRRTHAFVVQTPEVADELVELGFSRERVVVIESGVALDQFRQFSEAERETAKSALGLSGTRTALYCGRFDLGQKRLDLLLEAWPRADLPEWRLVLAGDGWDRPAVERLAADLAPSVQVLPWRDDVRDFYAAADMFVLPTSQEGMSRALVEGLASALPGVVSRTAGHESMGLEGVVLAPNTADAWASELQALARDDVRRSTLGGRGRAWVEARADSERMLVEFEHVLFGS